MNDLFSFVQSDRAYARSTHPQTSHDAAANVDFPEKQMRVYEVLSKHGRLMAEEISKISGVILQSTTPALSALQKKNIIQTIPLQDGNVLTRPGASGAQRQVYEVQPNKALWTNADDYVQPKTKEVKRLESELSRLMAILDFNNIAY
tara:strand:- start:5 stop:445 length:441 start_codon:yes stop_codon:yes gene_type:complete